MTAVRPGGSNPGGGYVPGRSGTGTSGPMGQIGALGASNLP